jgi:hypothetical protein
MEGATFADLMHQVYSDGDWSWNDSWLMWGEARTWVVGRIQKSADSNNVPLRSLWKKLAWFLLRVGSAERWKQNRIVRSGEEVEGKLLWATEKGGGGNSHCRWVWCLGVEVTTAVALWLNHIKNWRPAAGQLVRELAGGQTAPANYLGAMMS